MSFAAELEYPPPARPRLARAACGGVALSLHGVPATLRCSGALWFSRARTLVVADLHLEKGSAYGARGQLLPPYDTRETLGRLAAEVADLSPSVLVLLGDSFHDRRAEDRLDREDAAAIEAIARACALIWVVGNHDAEGPRRLPGEIADRLEVEGLSLLHEPTPGHAAGEVAGHLHPAAKLVRYGRGVRSRCFLTDGERLILPAFGAYAGGLNVLDAAFAGLFAGEAMAVALGRGRAHALALTTLSAD
jgi:DNA ligase-associated metallophosphoesterase